MEDNKLWQYDEKLIISKNNRNIKFFTNYYKIKSSIKKNKQIFFKFSLLKSSLISIVIIIIIPTIILIYGMIIQNKRVEQPIF